MGVKASKVSHWYDAAPAALLRNAADGAETATAIEASVSLNELDQAYWHDGEIPHGQLTVVVHVTAIDNTTTDETYTIDLIVDDVAAMNDTPRVVATLPLATKQPGVYVMTVDSRSIPLLDTDSSGTDKFLAARATLGGTTPSITYGAWIAGSKAR